MGKQFGAKVSNELKARYSKSPNWAANKFMNLETTSMNLSFQALPKLLYKQFFETKGRMPEKPLPVVPFDKAAFLADDAAPRFVWLGHSAVLLRWLGKTILIDPMLGPNASPIAPFATKRFSEGVLHMIDDFPPIDLLLMTHDHYDHLDLASIEKLKGKTSRWFVALGVARHLEAWGVPAADMQEFDWWDEADFAGIHFTFTPSRHFSGRGLQDRSKSLWGGWAMRASNANIYWSGDSGYGDHFKAVGEKLGPFDFGFMECGQYNQNWHQIHMYPEEAVQAAFDAGVKCGMPVHCCGFALAQHHWKDPIERFAAEASSKGLSYATPNIGAIATMEAHANHWWEAHS